MDGAAARSAVSSGKHRQVGGTVVRVEEGSTINISVTTFKLLLHHLYTRIYIHGQWSNGTNINVQYLSVAWRVLRERADENIPMSLLTSALQHFQ